MNNQSEIFPRDLQALPSASIPSQQRLDDRAHVDLRIAPVRKRIGDAEVRMLAYNGSIPGPTLRVRQGSELTVHVTNDGDLEATVHWHGLRLSNRYDGTTETQAPMQVGEGFEYRLTFPDPGVYWYHPHIREDYAQELGLYGNIIVEPEVSDYWGPAHRELALTLDDILIEDGQVAAFRRAETTHSAMGRFGNALLVNGETDLQLAARQGEVVRLFLTNTANTRVFNVALPGARLKRVGGDSGRVEREELVESVVIAPSERVVVDALFSTSGLLTLEHRTPSRTYALASIQVESAADALSSEATDFERLRSNADMRVERARIAPYLSAEPDKTIELIAEMDMGTPEVEEGAALEYYCPMHAHVVSHEPGRCPECHMKLLARAADSATAIRPDDAHGHTAQHGHGHGGHAQAGAPKGDGIEWEDDMVEVNRLTTPANTRWKIVDRASGLSGKDIRWRFRVGEQIKLRIVNTLDSDHPMHHPFHIHGAGRFLILARDGVVEPNLVWKDTVLVPMGQTVDILLDVTNRGRWMAHCHIAEHHESGMMFSFDVEA